MPHPIDIAQLRPESPGWQTFKDTFDGQGLVLSNEYVLVRRVEYQGLQAIVRTPGTICEYEGTAEYAEDFAARLLGLQRGVGHTSLEQQLEYSIPELTVVTKAFDAKPMSELSVEEAACITRDDLAALLNTVEYTFSRDIFADNGSGDNYLYRPGLPIRLVDYAFFGPGDANTNVSQEFADFLYCVGLDPLTDSSADKAMARVWQNILQTGRDLLLTEYPNTYKSLGMSGIADRKWLRTLKY